ncbi:MAG: hypothetical protein OXJ53_19800 [Gammaproteobacteria bacterium]|nr:hypothetical protein [Gammaproteobacteria bacterium]MDE0270967.1 hypothetical protein [Gammaproteobacteria bacterium]
MAEDDAIESVELIKQRVAEHKSNYRGSEIPDIYANYFVALVIADSIRSEESLGLTESATRRLREHLVTNFDYDAIVTAATADLKTEFATQYASKASSTYSLAALMDEIEEVEYEAVANRYKAAIGGLEAADLAIVTTKVNEILAQTSFSKIDHASLSVDVPNYVRSLVVKQVDGLSEPELALGRALHMETTASSSTASSSKPRIINRP